MNHVFMITSVGILTATDVQAFVAVLFVIHLVSHDLISPAWRIFINDAFYGLLFSRNAALRAM